MPYRKLLALPELNKPNILLLHACRQASDTAQGAERSKDHQYKHKVYAKQKWISVHLTYYCIETSTSLS